MSHTVYLPKKSFPVITARYSRRVMHPKSTFKCLGVGAYSIGLSSPAGQPPYNPAAPFKGLGQWDFTAKLWETVYAD